MLLAKPLVNPIEIARNTSISIAKETPSSSSSEANNDVASAFPNLSNASNGHQKISNTNGTKVEPTSKGPLDIEIAPKTPENFVVKDTTIRIDSMPIDTTGKENDERKIEKNDIDEMALSIEKFGSFEKFDQPPNQEKSNK